MQSAKGENFFGKVKNLPTTKDYYKLYSEPIDAMSSKGKIYLKESGLLNIDTGKHIIKRYTVSVASTMNLFQFKKNNMSNNTEISKIFLKIQKI